jgi:hypothetical protein
VFLLAASVIPASIAVAMLRYRLYDIDLIIDRVLVYGDLTAGVAGLYVLAVGYLGTVLHTGNNLGVPLLATGLVTVLFHPLRDRLQRAINHLMYGERDDPYAVISRLGQRLDQTLSSEALLPAAVEVAAYRAVQEALTNVVRHAYAQNCQIRLQILPEGDRMALELAIVVDGIDLAAERKAGVGLASMRERAAEHGGTLVIGTCADGGTSVRAHFPIPSPDGAVPSSIALQEAEEACPPDDGERARPEALARGR